VITFATNQMSYVQFALNCAQSILAHNDIPVFIVSNLDFPIPVKFRDRVFIIPAKPEHVSLGIGMKLYIDEYVQTEHTLFIDSDCICFGDLNDVFKACDGMDVTVVGNILPSADWCGEILAKTIKENWGLDKIIRYNGGLYYIKKTTLTKSVFDKAREIAEKYDDYGFDRIKNKWINEEGPLSISMMLNKQRPIADNGYFMTDLFTDQRPRQINVLRGSRLLRNPPAPLRKHRPWYPGQFSPLILHFGGSNIKSYPYRSQNLLLKLRRLHVSTTVASLLVNIFIHVPYRSFHWTIGSLRKLKTR
ncbi:MAG: hypothetical protein JWP37_3752, partial [Mucilaginibacter sp.]|nr:hypothetical protein [Mucilaginibacter sp.]